jgi:hypothetical protein
MPSVFSKDDVVPIDRWLLGHYNRMLPAKVSSRLLAVLSGGGKQALFLDEIAPRLSELAAWVGEHLRTLDERMQLHRDHALSIAFPEPGERGAKGRLRYQSHFVGQMVKGEQKGMLAGLKLVAMEVKRNRPLILLTPAGWEFARLENPVLDGGDVDRPQSFSSQEIDYLLRHICEHVPAERFAYRLILSLISNGKNVPDAINKALGQYTGAGRSVGDMDTFLSTHRGGVLGRAKDLQLIERERLGTSFRYHLSDRGAEFLDTVGKME